MAERKIVIRPGRLADVPPWCYWRPGMSPEAAALAAARALEVTHPLDLLNLLLAMRWHVRTHNSTPAAVMPETQPAIPRRNA